MQSCAGSRSRGWRARSRGRRFSRLHWCTKHGCAWARTPALRTARIFFSAAAEAMRRILIDRARRKLAARHGGGQERLDLDEVEIAAPLQKEDELLAVHEALDSL